MPTHHRGGERDTPRLQCLSHVALCRGKGLSPDAAKLAKLPQALTSSVRVRAAMSEPESSAALDATTRLGWDDRGFHVRLDETAEGVVSMGMEGRLNSAICAVNPWLSGLVSGCMVPHLNSSLPPGSALRSAGAQAPC